MHDPRVLVRCQGGARGVGIILVSAVEEVDSPERPFKERCRPQRPEDLRLGRTEERERESYIGGKGAVSVFCSHASEVHIAGNSLSHI